MTHRSTPGLICMATGLLAAATPYALELEVQRFDNSGGVPLGYQDVSDGIDPGQVVNVSAEPFEDYLIPNNSGSAGITAAKFGGEYITESTVADMGGDSGGANSLANIDIYQVVFQWTDGDPLPAASDYYGVSWSGWSSSGTASLDTRVDLAAEGTVTVYHWFNDGWNYADGGHDTLDGHNLTVTHLNAAGDTIAEESVVLPSGGAEDIFGDHRQFYTAIISATRTAAGDYLLINNTGGNIGYKGTAITVEESAGPETGPGEFSEFELVDSWLDSGSFMGWVNVEYYPYVWVSHLDDYIYSAEGSGWYYISK